MNAQPQKQLKLLDLMKRPFCHGEATCFDPLDDDCHTCACYDSCREKLESSRG